MEGTRVNRTSERIKTQVRRGSVNNRIGIFFLRPRTLARQRQSNQAMFLKKNPRLTSKPSQTKPKSSHVVTVNVPQGSEHCMNKPKDTKPPELLVLQTRQKKGTESEPYPMNTNLLTTNIAGAGTMLGPVG